MKQPNVFLWLVLTHAGHMYVPVPTCTHTYILQRESSGVGRQKERERKVGRERLPPLPLAR